MFFYTFIQRFRVDFSSPEFDEFALVQLLQLVHVLVQEPNGVSVSGRVHTALCPQPPDPRQVGGQLVVQAPHLIHLPGGHSIYHLARGGRVSPGAVQVSLSLAGTRAPQRGSVIVSRHSGSIGR